MFRLALAALALAVPSSPLAAQQPPAAVADLQLEPARIDRLLQQMVADGRIAGASVLIWKDGREAYYGHAGYADREARRPIARDTLYQIHSMTKPVTGVGLMRLWEAGRFGLDEPLAKYLPEYATTKVFKGLKADGSPILKAPERPILIRDILRHTAGFGYWAGEAYPERVFARLDPLNMDNTLAQFSRKNAQVPLFFDPGTQWRYSDAVDVQARLIEVLTGLTFEDYMLSQVLRPLGMTEAAWTQPESRYARIAMPYRGSDSGTLTRLDEKEVRLDNFSDRKLTMGGSGLASTADDYMRFARMLLGEGSLNGVRIIKPSTVALMATDQLDPKVTERMWLPEKGNVGFGFDLAVRLGRPKDDKENRGATGEFFWDGSWTSLFWVDPHNRMAVVFMVQKDPYDFSLVQDIRKAVYGPNYLGPKGD
ncbi:beta-lactamase family protein [Sphingomonas sabuli]|uniref:Beta-lactamase family protein n=1 Tax=Sphingomonas sabuli TaxID=2764186 RepID=A0A7G9L366_9SPHN|nr:serine hydrolase domain-containing protein [Sphingomonas sabuli]QNM83065.1 beta-lactamase family protein [Sphingomonas sabuli]